MCVQDVPDSDGCRGDSFAEINCEGVLDSSRLRVTKFPLVHWFFKEQLRNVREPPPPLLNFHFRDPSLQLVSPSKGNISDMF